MNEVASFAKKIYAISCRYQTLEVKSVDKLAVGGHHWVHKTLKVWRYSAFGVRSGAILSSAEWTLIVFACWTVATADAAESIDKPIATRHLASRQPHYQLVTVRPSHFALTPHHCHRSRVIFVLMPLVPLCVGSFSFLSFSFNFPYTCLFKVLSRVDFFQWT